MKKEAKEKIKNIKEIPSKIKEIKLQGMDESKLEENINEIEREEFREFITTGQMTAPVLESLDEEEQVQQVKEISVPRPATAVDQRPIYAARPAEEDERIYTTGARRPDITLRPETESAIRRENPFEASEIARRGGSEVTEKEYEHLKPQKDDKKKKTYEW